jgi:hypothetical protein
VREEHYSPLEGPLPEQTRLEAVTVFVLVRVRGDVTDSMRGFAATRPAWV